MQPCSHYIIFALPSYALKQDLSRSSPYQSSAARLLTDIHVPLVNVSYLRLRLRLPRVRLKFRHGVNMSSEPTILPSVPSIRTTRSIRTRHIALLCKNMDRYASGADDAVLRELVEAFWQEGGYSILMLRREISIYNAQSITTIRHRNRPVEIIFNDYTANIIVSPSATTTHHWDVLFRSPHADDVRASGVPDTGLMQQVFDLVSSVL